MASDRQQLVALELIRRGLEQMPMGIVRQMAQAGTIYLPGLTPTSATGSANRSSAPTSAAGQAATQYPSPSLNPKPAAPPIRGYAEAGALKLAGLVQSILTNVAALRSLQATGNAINKARGAAGPPRRVSRSVRRLYNSTPARRIRRDFSLLRQGLGFGANNRLTRAGAWAGGRAAGGVAKLAGKGVSAAGGGLAMLLKPMMMIVGLLGPMALFAATLQSATSGFGLVTTSVKLLAATIGPILMPFLFLLASGLAAASDMIWQELAPALGDWFTLIITRGVPVIEEFLGAVQQVIEFVKLAVQKDAELADRAEHADQGHGDSFFTDTWLGRQASKVGTWAGLNPGDDATPYRAGDLSKPGNRWMDDPEYTEAFGGPTPAAAPPAARPPDGPPAAGGMVGPPAPPLSVGERLRESMKEVQAEFQFQNGPKASFSGFAQANKSAQLAALNESPFEKKMQERMFKVIEELGKVVNNTTPRPEPRHGGR